MPRGNAPQSKVHYQGKVDDFVIMVDDIKSVQNWKDDRSIPLAHVVSGFKIFVTHKYVSLVPPPMSGRPLAGTHNCVRVKQTLMRAMYDRHGAQNAYDSPSKQTLESEFGTHNEDECIIKILEGGTLQETEVGNEYFEVTCQC